MPYEPRLPAVGMARRKEALAGGRRQELCQLRHELARNSQIRRFKSFREAAVYEREVMAGLIALSAFSEQARLVNCRPELQRERGLCLCDCKRLGQAVHGRFSAILWHGCQNLSFNS